MPTAEFSTIKLELRPNAVEATRLEQAFRAAGSLERAVTREGLRRLRLLRESKGWRAACKLPTGNDAEVSARNTALNALRKKAGLTETSFKDYAQQVRRDSVWMCDHLDSQCAAVHGAAVWARFENHLFSGARLPRTPRAVTSSLRGRSRDRGTDTTPAKWQSITLRGSYDAGRFQRDGHVRPRSWETFTGGLAMVWNPRQGRGRELVVPVETAWPKTSGRMSSTAARVRYYLEDVDAWRRCTIVRVRRRNRVRYELHLLVEKTPYRGDRYSHAPQATVGIDTGVSSVAAVGVVGDHVTAALNVKLSKGERAHAAAEQKELRRLQRRADRSLRAANPHAFGSDRKGRVGRGSYVPGERLERSKSYWRVRSQIRELHRKAAETRTRRVDAIAAAIVTQIGVDVVVEDTDKRTWQRRWGKSLALFTPAALETVIEREAVLAGGSFTKVPCKLSLTRTCHCGAVRPKSLSERTHTCEACGSMPVDRDVHAAYLAAHVVDTGDDTYTLDVTSANRAWSGAEQLLSAASKSPIPAQGCWDRSTTRTELTCVGAVERWSQTNVETPDPAEVVYPEHVVHPTAGGGVPDGSRDVNDLRAPASTGSTGRT